MVRLKKNIWLNLKQKQILRVNERHVKVFLSSDEKLFSTKFTIKDENYHTFLCYKNLIIKFQEEHFLVQKTSIKTTC